MKYAIIGCGRIAVNHIKAVINNELDMVAMCDLSLDAIDNLIKKTEYNKKVEKYTDFRKMINEHPEIELISIATDSGSHASIAIECLDKGIHLIIEKPIAMSLADADKIIKIADKNGAKVSVCHQNRFNKAVQELRKAIEDGKFGKISHGSINVRWNRNKEYYDQADWRGKWATDGGALMNQCIHGIDLLRWMMGDEVDEIYGVTRQRYHDYLECEDVGIAVIKFRNGAIGTIEGTVNVYPKNLEETLYVFGETGTVKLGGTSCNNIDVWNLEDSNEEKAGMKEATSNVYGNGHTSLFADMVDAINNCREPYIDAHAGRNALEMVLSIYKSQLTNQPVKLPLKDFSSVDMCGEFG